MRHSAYLLLLECDSAGYGCLLYSRRCFSIRRTVAAVTLVLAVTSVLFTTWSLLVSTVAITTDGAVRGTFGGVLVMFLLVLLPHYFLDGSESSLAGIAAILRNVSPVPAIMDVVGHADVGSRQLVSQNSGVMAFTLFGGILGLLFAGMTISRPESVAADRGPARRAT